MNKLFLAILFFVFGFIAGEYSFTIENNPEILKDNAIELAAFAYEYGCNTGITLINKKENKTKDCRLLAIDYKRDITGFIKTQGFRR